MQAALAPEKGGDPRSGEDRRLILPMVFYLFISLDHRIEAVADRCCKFLVAVVI